MPHTPAKLSTGQGGLLADDLAQWVRGFRSLDIPAPVRERARLILLDTLACMFAGAHDHAAHLTVDLVRDLGGAPQCMVFGAGFRTSAPHAVLANGTLIRCLDFNDFYLRGGQVGHPSDNLAVAFAMAEMQRSSGDMLLRAIVMGYELYCRLQDISDPLGPWDHVSASGLVAPAIAGFLMDLPAPVLADAMAIGGAHCHTLACLRDGDLSVAKALANAQVAQMGVTAALLAARGATGPRSSLDGVRGIANGLLPRGTEDLLAPPDGFFLIGEVSLKAFPSVGSSQTAVAAALKLRARAGFDVAAVQRLELQLPDVRIARSQLDAGLRDPRTKESADHSCYFLIAAALLDGELGMRQFDHDRWHDPAIRALMGRTEVRLDLPAATDGAFPAVLTATLASGARHTVEVRFAPGHPRNPLELAEVEQKLRAALAPAQADAWIIAVHRLDTVDDFAALLRTL